MLCKLNQTKDKTNIIFTVIQPQLMNNVQIWPREQLHDGQQAKGGN